MEPTQQIHEEIESVLVQKKGPEVRKKPLIFAFRSPCSDLGLIIVKSHGSVVIICPGPTGYDASISLCHGNFPLCVW
jgi:hypothetical protein